MRGGWGHPPRKTRKTHGSKITRPGKTGRGTRGVMAMGMYGESTGWLTWGALGLLTLGVAVAEPALADGPGSQPAGVHGRLQAVPFEKVRVDDPFWSPRIETSQDVTIPDLLAIAEEQGKIDNVRLVAGRKKTGRIRMYNSPDSDIWKIMEAASYTLAWRPSAKIEEKLDELIDLYAAAQACCRRETPT